MSAKLFQGDCRDVMRGMGAQSIHAVVTDPPYGLSFMDKEWDRVVPDNGFWAEALRVAKHGAHLLAFGGSRTFHRLACAIEDAGWEVRDVVMWVYGTGFPKSLNLGGGWGTALKPAYEPILLARKPLPKGVSTARNIEATRCGGLNIEACRIGNENTQRRCNVSLGSSGSNVFGAAGGGLFGSESGRYPANLVHDGSPEVLAGFPSESAARFFYCAKANRNDRDEGLGHHPVQPKAILTGRKEGSAGMNSPRAGAGRTNGRRNTHPTVKPSDLMRYLCRLITPVGGTVMDPFMGSGSTGKAAILEGFDFVGIDLDPESVKIAQGRIDHALRLRGLPADNGEPPVLKPHYPYQGSLLDLLKVPA